MKSRSGRRSSTIDRAARDAAVDFLLHKLRDDGEVGKTVPHSTEDAAFDMRSETEEILWLECEGRDRREEFREAVGRYLLLLCTDDPYQERPETDLRHWPYCDRESLIRAWQWATTGKGIDLPHPDTYPSRRKRILAAKLLRDYLDGRMSMAQVRRRWPEDPFETILRRIKGLVLQHLPGRKLASIANPQRQNQIRELLARCQRFLETDEVYAWPRLQKDYVFWPFLAFLALTFGSPLIVFLILSPLLLVWDHIDGQSSGALAGASFLVVFGIGFVIAGMALYRCATQYRRFFHGTLAEWPFLSQRLPLKGEQT